MSLTPSAREKFFHGITVSPKTAILCGALETEIELWEGYYVIPATYKTLRVDQKWVEDDEDEYAKQLLAHIIACRML